MAENKFDHIIITTVRSVKKDLKFFCFIEFAIKF